jgi:hypothetical protein
MTARMDGNRKPVTTKSPMYPYPFRSWILCDRSEP